MGKEQSESKIAGNVGKQEKVKKTGKLRKLDGLQLLEVGRIVLEYYIRGVV